MTLLGEAAPDVLTRADIWFKLLSLGIACRTDEGDFVLNGKYFPGDSMDISGAWQQYYYYWAKELAQVNDR